MKIHSSFSALVCSLTLSALIPSACSGDSSEQDDGGSGTGGDEGGADGKGGSAGTGGKGGTSGTGVGGSSGTAGKGGTSAGGTSGAAGEGGVGASGGEGGGEAGEGGGGAPNCPFASDATVSGTLEITADDYYRLYVNGALIDDVQRIWTSPQTYTVNVFRNPSRKNVLAVEALNAAEINGLDRGVIVDLSFDAGAGLRSVLSDKSWKLSPTLVADWFEVAFVDTAWVAATEEGVHGIPPYGEILGTSSALWLWSYDANIAADLKPTTETIWVRKTFYLDASGSVTEGPTACP